MAAKTNAKKGSNSPTLTMNIKREYFAAIVATPPRKTIEYRDASKYWQARLAKVGAAPFRLRLLNGMTPPVPEATVEVLKVIKRNGELRFHLGRVLQVKHWDRKREKPGL